MNKLELDNLKIDYEKQINELKSEIKNLRLSPNEKIYELKDLDENREHNFPIFKFLNLNWNLKLNIDNNFHLHVYLVLLSDLNSVDDLAEKCVINYKLKIFFQNSSKLNQISEEELIFTKKQSILLTNSNSDKDYFIYYVNKQVIKLELDGYISEN